MARIGILTTGHIHTPGFVKRLKERADVQVAGVWDPDGGLAEKYGKELGAAVVGTPEKILGDRSIEAVVIVGTTAAA